MRPKIPKKAPRGMDDFIEDGRALVELHIATARRLEHMMDELHQRHPLMVHHWSNQVGIYVEDDDGDYAWGIDDKIRVTIH